MNPLSAEQREAVSLLDVDLALSAAAGSGKTTVLVERFLEVVTQKRAAPESILAVTFTDKAANAMKERLRKRARELKLDELSAALDNAWIGTIHSFCARFLRENPIECGVDPDFKVLAGGEEALLYHRLMDELLEEEANNEDWMFFLAENKEENVRRMVKAHYEMYRSYGEDNRLLRTGNSMQAKQEAEGELQKCLDRIRMIRDGGRRLTASAEKLICASEEIRSLTGAGKSSSWERLRGVERALSAVSARGADAKEFVQELKEAVRCWTALEVQSLGDGKKNVYLKFFQKFCRLYDERKRRDALYDFDDLLLVVWKTLSSDKPQQLALRERARQRFSYLFVDEFQDTSFLQAKIIDFLKRKSNLFVVGDARQSIYGFRHAHVEIFKEVVRRSRQARLSGNYRSQPIVIEFVNDFFRQSFPDEAPMQALRSDSTKGPRGSVSWLVTRKCGRALDEARIEEAARLAEAIQKRVETGRFRYGEIAVLFRRMSSSRIYEAELIRSQIPYVSYKGEGFFERPEIRDVINLLKVIENPQDDLAYFSVLRSPLVQLTDDGLYWIAKNHQLVDPEGGFSESSRNVEAIAGLKSHDRRRLSEFNEWLNRLRGLKDRKTLPNLLWQILDESAYEAKLLIRPHGRQAQANLWKLVERIDEIERQGFGGVSSFIQYVRGMEELEEVEEQAKIIGEHQNAVKILTIHASKGLEFPCVFIADLGGKTNEKTHHVIKFSMSAGMGMKVRDSDTMKTYEDQSYIMAKESELRVEEEESNRLFYVAMTRAMDELVFSGVLDERPDKKSSNGAETWMSRLAAYSDRFICEDTRGEQKVVVRKEPEPESMSSRAAFQNLGEPLAVNVDQLMDRMRVRVKPYEKIEDLTVSEIVSGMATLFNKKWAPTSIDDEDEGGAEHDLETKEEEFRLPRNEFGTVFHKIMERSVMRVIKNDKSDLIQDGLLRYLSEGEKEEIVRSHDAFWKSRYGSELKTASARHPELPFIFKTKHGLLKGQMDLVYRSQEGWVILDYKTNQLLNDEEMKAAVENYSWQLGLYALAFWKLFGELPHKTVLYFTRYSKGVERKWNEADLERIGKELDTQYSKLVLLDEDRSIHP